ncbi:DNA-binding protein H-NS [Rhodoblastus acidophilus]|uniref:H-NS histone family protein n=1 Tax=Rhodoblastus acidophilus TaxID=1074 RepID=UPI0022240A16|nr:H-NS histone family protein [Rhodoblastus acidophilus]MCW2283349.1 DNA-binding protein H-NS [Rhodoblastus acidophilus]MCW2332327.1 DNA-binding protein H-NS [Rhodoblastus acidophilus]
MRISDIEAMDFEELWRLHEELTRVLAEKIVAEKRELEKRLAQLVGGEAGGDAAPARKYPKVVPKYRNPASPDETWSGRGKRPKWLVKALAAGHTLDEFKIDAGGSERP